MYKPQFYTLTFATLVCLLSALPCLADSQVRIVRLSDVQGTVQIDKNSGLGFERAFDNLPIVQGTELRTLDNGRAEVEFEDGSTLRITPNTTVVFSALSLSDAGNRASSVNLVQGRAYVNWLGKSGDEFTLSFSGEKVDLLEAAHFRVSNSSSTAELASFKNAVEVTGPSGAVKVEKNKEVAFDPNDNDKATVAKDFKSDSYDQWDEQAGEYHQQYSKNNSAPYGYGASDLSYYGAYSSVPGYGQLWQPYFAGAGWDPFMDGAWSWYPGMGFLWASAYPWGWMPYYYGNWVYAPGYGWGWQPGGWNTWHGGIHYVGATASSFHAPVPPVGTVNSAIVGRAGTSAESSSETKLVMNARSAGLGIPRGSYDDLRHYNKEIAKTGSVELRPAAQFAASSVHISGFGFGGPGSGAIELGGGHAASAGAGHNVGAVGGHH
jgi:hypothetical protein